MSCYYFSEYGNVCYSNNSNVTVSFINIITYITDCINHPDENSINHILYRLKISIASELPIDLVYLNRLINYLFDDITYYLAVWSYNDSNLVKRTLVDRSVCKTISLQSPLQNYYIADQNTLNLIEKFFLIALLDIIRNPEVQSLVVKL